MSSTTPECCESMPTRILNDVSRCQTRHPCRTIDHQRVSHSGLHLHHHEQRQVQKVNKAQIKSSGHAGSDGEQHQHMFQRRSRVSPTLPPQAQHRCRPDVQIINPTPSGIHRHAHTSVAIIAEEHSPARVRKLDRKGIIILRRHNSSTGFSRHERGCHRPTRTQTCQPLLSR